MKQFWISVTFALACTITLVHIFVGGRLIAAPLLESNLPDLARLTLYLCWHGVTIVLGGIAALVALNLFGRSQPGALKLATVLAACFFVLGWTMIIGFRVSPLTLPQWIAFGPMAICGWMALRSQPKAISANQRQDRN